MEINTTACQGTHQYIKYIEHVQVFTSVYHYNRGAIEISIQSPMGTMSWVLRRRKLDKRSGEFNQWRFLSNHFWGEDPRGTWKVTFYSAGNPCCLFFVFVRPKSDAIYTERSSQNR